MNGQFTNYKYRRLQKYIINYLGLAPFFILFTIFILTPIVRGILMSFTNWSLSNKESINFVGFENYLYILSGDTISSIRFIKSIKNLAIYVPVTVTVGISISLGLALIVSHIQQRLYKIFRGIYFIPTVLPLFLVTGIWQWFMAPETGLVASNLAKIGIGRDVIWTQEPGYAIAMVVLIDVWNSVGFNFIIFSTGILSVSPEIFEAAEIDGASALQKMIYITIPLIEPTIFFVTAYSFISALQVYDIPWILTATADINAAGGQGQVMLFPVMEMVRNIYSGGKSALGRAAAEGVILMFIISLVTFIQFISRRKTV